MSIGTKFIIVVTVLIVSAIGIVTWITTDLFREDTTARIQETNKDTAQYLADRLFGTFKETQQKMSLMSRLAAKDNFSEESLTSVQDLINADENLLSFSAYKFGAKGELIHQFTKYNTVGAAEFGLTDKDFSKSVYGVFDALHGVGLSEVTVVNSSGFFKVPLLTMGFLAQKEKESPQDTAWSFAWLKDRMLFKAELRQEPIVRMFSKSKLHEAFVVDSAGRLVAHSNVDKKSDVINGLSLSKNYIVYKMLTESQIDNRQMEYDNEDGETYLAAYKKIGVAGLGVVAQVKQKNAFATLEKVIYRSTLFMVVILSFAILLNYAFSTSITGPLEDLFHATEKVVEGQYDVDLTVDSDDEIGALSEAFINMTEGLKEREKLKGAFNKFHSKEVAKKLLSGEIKLGGERRHATVFFSDIRNFTSLVEHMTPDQVVHFLNEYMTEMVNITFKWNGIVDKYIGDAIMAVWGVPEVTAKDAYNSVRAALEMREFLISWNHKRRSNGSFEIHIGMGLFSGDLLAGNIGSEHRLEYTVIGDTVNQASRIEQACKILKTDLLIGHSTMTLVDSLGIVCGPGIKIQAKGKSSDVIVHKVIGYKDENGVLKSSLGHDEIEAIKHQSADIQIEEESKVRVGGQPDKEKEQDHNTSTRQMPPPRPEKKFYVLDALGTTSEGPFTIKEISLKIAQRQIDFQQSFLLEDGGLQMIPLSEMMGLNRRQAAEPSIRVSPPPPPLMQEASNDEWYVYGPNGQSVGPYSLLDLEMAIAKGSLTRTTYVWKKDLPNWIYLYQIPGFDRRAA